MVITQNGYEFRGYKIGQTVEYDGIKYKIVALDDSEDDNFIAIKSYGKVWLTPSEIKVYKDYIITYMWYTSDGEKGNGHHMFSETSLSNSKLCDLLDTLKEDYGYTTVVILNVICTSDL